MWPGLWFSLVFVLFLLDTAVFPTVCISFGFFFFFLFIYADSYAIVCAINMLLGITHALELGSPITIAKKR